MFYRINKIHLLNTNVLYKFLKNIGYARRQHITSIVFGWTSHDKQAKKAFRILKTCSSLKSIEIMLSSFERKTWYEPPNHSTALKEVRGMAEVQIRVHTPWETDFSKTNLDRTAFRELRTAMMRPRLKQFVVDSVFDIDPFKARRKQSRRSEEDLTGAGSGIGQCARWQANEVRYTTEREWIRQYGFRKLEGSLFEDEENKGPEDLLSVSRSSE